MPRDPMNPRIVLELRKIGLSMPWFGTQVGCRVGKCFGALCNLGALWAKARAPSPESIHLQPEALQAPRPRDQSIMKGGS